MYPIGDMNIIGKNMEVQPCVATIGSFDGVHQGHRFVIQQVVFQARKRGLDAVVVTFPNHPLQVLRDDFRPQLLTLAEEKVKLMQQTDIEKIAIMDFTRDLAQMSAREFMQHILKEQLQVKVLVMGHDNHFGHGKTAFEDYVRYGHELGMEVLSVPPMPHGDGCPISSTAIRGALLSGDVACANAMLGYRYALQGLVVEGFQNGKRLGFPTANLQVDPSKLVPKNGAYLVRTCGFPTCADARQGLCRGERYGMLNIGTRPTLHNGSQRSIEVHLFDFDGDLYGTRLCIELLHHLRNEREFRSLEELQCQLANDEQVCHQLLTLHAYD